MEPCFPDNNTTKIIYFIVNGYCKKCCFFLGGKDTLMKSAKPPVFLWCMSIYKDHFYTAFLHEIKENILTIIKMIHYSDRLF